MIGYDEFIALSRSTDSEQRGMAAHLAARAYLSHDGPADEHAALYAALFGFLEDRSVKVRAALAYGLLHAHEAPRPLILALLQDNSVISRAVLQYSPVLIDADILPLVERLDIGGRLAIVQRTTLSQSLVLRLLACAEREVCLQLVRRSDLALSAEALALADQRFQYADMRGALLARRDLPPDLRFALVRRVGEALREVKMVKGAVAADRLDRLLRNCEDAAMTTIGDGAGGATAGRDYAAGLIAEDRLSTRVLLHALVHGHVLFFSHCCAELSGMPAQKVFGLLESGGRVALNALFARCGLSPAVRNVLARLIAHAREVDLADDVAARHYVVTALTEDLIAEHDGDMPSEIAETFAYLGEQNVALARLAAQGVMAAFAEEADAELAMPEESEERLALPAA